MISHKHQCVFVHVPKAAGTSIERVFMEDLGVDMDNRHALLLGKSTNENIGPRRVSHLTANEYVEHHFLSKELFDNYFKFAFVREPKSRLYSTYKFLKFNETMSFDEFINSKLDELLSTPKFDFFLKPSYDYLFNKNGKCLVDFVGKFEDLNEDFDKVRKEIKFISSGGILQHYNKTNDGEKNKIKLGLKKIKNYKTLSSKDSAHLSDVSIQKILSYYKNDYIKFGYSKPAN